MKKVSFRNLEFIPASHEDPQNPGSLKKVLFLFSDIREKTRIQMINWARLLPEKSFRIHYHEDMDEIFIILNGKVKIVVGEEQNILEKGDAVFIPMRIKHMMLNMNNTHVDYIAIGLSLRKKGKTITV